jgi:hypothetical protein
VRSSHARLLGDGKSREFMAHARAKRQPPNKGMKLTSVEPIGRSQLIPSVRPT